VRNINVIYFALSELAVITRFGPGATRLAPLGTCPWLSYFAPLALLNNFAATVFHPYALNII